MSDIVEALRSEDLTCRDCSARCARAADALERLRAALDGLYQLCLHANRGAFENGVTDPTGTIDEGNVRAGQFIDDARRALAGTSGEQNIPNGK